MVCVSFLQKCYDVFMVCGNDRCKCFNVVTHDIIFLKFQVSKWWDMLSFPIGQVGSMITNNQFHKVESNTLKCTNDDECVFHMHPWYKVNLLSALQVDGVGGVLLVQPTLTHAIVGK